MSAAKQINYPIKENVNIGEVRISEEVVIVIAALAATEVKGVESMAGNVTNELVSHLGAGKLSKGVKLHVGEKTIDVNLSINLVDGYEIPEVCEKVQEKVKSAIETMTGLKVKSVNVKKGEQITQNTLIGKSGEVTLDVNLKNALLFEIIKDGKYINPETLYNKKVKEI